MQAVHWTQPRPQTGRPPDIVTVPGVKNAFFGGEGLFNTVVTGPGHIWLQTMPISNVAAVLRPFFPSSNN